MTTYIPYGTGSGGVGSAQVNLKATINITGSDSGDVIDIQLSNVNSPSTVQLLNLISGVNTINSTNCPALPGSGMVVIVPPTGNLTSITLKGVTGDTGVALSLTAPTMLPFTVSPPTSFVLTAGGAITGLKLIWL